MAVSGIRAACRSPSTDGITHTEAAMVDPLMQNILDTRAVAAAKARFLRDGTAAGPARAHAQPRPERADGRPSTWPPAARGT